MKTLSPRRPANAKRSRRTGAAPAARRAPSTRLTGEEMMRELDKLAPRCPPMDTKAFLDDGE